MSEPIRANRLVPCRCRANCGRLVERGLGGYKRISPQCKARQQAARDAKYRERQRQAREELRREALNASVAAIEREYQQALATVKATRAFTLEPWATKGSCTKEHSISRALRSTRGRGAA